jgi:hypothetical protein
MFLWSLVSKTSAYAALNHVYISRVVYKPRKKNTWQLPFVHTLQEYICAPSSTSKAHHRRAEGSMVSRNSERYDVRPLNSSL